MDLPSPESVASRQEMRGETDFSPHVFITVTGMWIMFVKKLYLHICVYIYLQAMKEIDSMKMWNSFYDSITQLSSNIRREFNPTTLINDFTDIFRKKHKRTEIRRQYDENVIVHGINEELKKETEFDDSKTDIDPKFVYIIDKLPTELQLEIVSYIPMNGFLKKANGMKIIKISRTIHENYYDDECGDPFDSFNLSNWDGDQQVGFR